MITSTSPLTQMNMQSSYASQNTTPQPQGMSFTRMLPMLLVNAAAPFAINMIAQHYMSTIDALLLASSVPALFTLGGVIWKKRIDAMGVLVVAGLLLSAVVALLFNSPRLLLLQSSAVNGLLGVVMLVSLLFAKPILFYIVRSIVTQHDAQRIASFNADWAFPQFRTCYRTLTAVWGCVMLATLVLHTALVFTLPISLMLIINPFLGFALILPAAHWSMSYLRKNQRIFAQLRQQRDAATA